MAKAKPKTKARATPAAQSQQEAEADIARLGDIQRELARIQADYGDEAASLKAAAHPAKTPYLYFVADGKGGHTFTTNLVSHNRAVQDYLKVLKEKNAQ